MARKAPSQQAFEFRTWGGARQGAGRRSARPRRGVPHVAREELRPWQPVHVTLRMAEHVWNLRSERSFRVIERALRAMVPRTEVRVVEFSVQGNHLHLLMESESASALANGMRSLTGRIAIGLNRMMRTRGPVFEDRYHTHVIRSPAEARNALAYVVHNFASHAARRGEPQRAGYVDRYSSAAAPTTAEPQRELFPRRLTVDPETWLLRNATKK